MAQLTRLFLSGLLLLTLPACAPALTPEPEQQPVVVTVPNVAIAAVTYTPSSPAVITLAPCEVEPCSLASPTPSPVASSAWLSPATLLPTETAAREATLTPPPTLKPLKPTVASPPSRSANAPTITETTLTLQAYDWQSHLLETAPTDPIYPYPRLDYDPFDFDPGRPAPQTFKGLVLENKYVSLTFLPELGGRLYRWVDKTTGRQLLYNNPVIKATGFGVRGWWLALGGLEWDLPLEDHGLVEWLPWNYATLTTPDTAAVIFSIVEERAGLECAIRLELDSTHSYFTLTPVLHNPTPDALVYQFWMAALVAPAGDNRAGADLRFNVPVDSMLIHSTDDKTLPPENQTISWPTYQGRDLSVYGNWREFLSLFAAPGAAQPYVGVYAPRADQGLVRIFPPSIARGLKLFGPGNLPPFTWTNDDSSYVELWGGLTPNFSENSLLQSEAGLTWTEYWYPFHGIGNFVWADKDRALAIDETGREVTVRLYTTSAQTVSLTLFVNRGPAARWEAATASPSTWQAQWPRGAAGPLGVLITDTLGNIIVRYGET